MLRGVAVAWIVVGSVGSVRADDRGDHAGDRFEASAYFGIAYYGDNTQLGNSWAPDQVPGTAPTLGARVLGIVVPDLGAIADARLQLAVEAEVGVATAFTGDAYGGRMQYFAPVFDWRAHAMLRASSLPYVRPHLVLGAGGETVASRSPYMAKETDPEVYWGVGTTIAFGDRWMARADVRHGLMPGRDGVEQTLEIQLGLGATFGLPRTVRKERVVVVPEPPVQPKVDDVADRDGDGIPDILDDCPGDKETVNGIDDGDGCPEDGAVAGVDPKRDRDGDGIADIVDRCPDQPETVNGIDDADGCPDSVPDTVLIAIASAQAMEFEPGRARLNDGAKESLGGLAAMLTDHADARLEVVVHAERAGAAAADLAKRRADAIKWFLVDQGVVADRIATPAGAVRPRPDRVPLVELTWK